MKCDYCKDSQWYRWSQSLGTDRLRAAMGAQASVIGDLQSITLDPPDSSGRPRFWTFMGSTGSARVKASDVRRAAGTRVIPSLLVHKVDLQADTQTATVDGAGLGHGVGFCQWGARGLAKTGADSAAILAYYFPGTTIGSS